MAKRQKFPSDTTLVGPDRKAVPAMHHFLASLEQASGFEQLDPIADLSGAATLSDTIAKVNALLAALRTAKILRT